MWKDSYLDTLTKILGPDGVSASYIDKLSYSFDFTKEVEPCCPDAIAFPVNTAQVSELLKFANEKKIAVTPRGAGTNIPGDVVPTERGIVIDLSRMNKIIEVDEVNMTATVQPGVITKHLQDIVEKKGLFFPPDPGSLSVSTLGGNIASNAGGTRGFKYGITRDYVMGIEVVFPNGHIQKYGGKTVKNVTGYDMCRLMVGSEGTLGIITEATLKLISLPEYNKTFLVMFDDLEKAADCALSVILNRLRPVMLEFIDTATIKAIEDYAGLGIPANVKAMLIIELDGQKDAVEKDSQKLEECCKKYAPIKTQIATSFEERNKIMDARRAILPALSRLKPHIIEGEATIPRSALAEMIKAIQKISEETGVMIATFGHAGDGNLHPAFLFDNRDDMSQVERAQQLTFNKAFELGGTTTGEQGIGLTKKEFMLQELGDEGVAIMKNIKLAVDPNNIMNPGKIF